MELLLVIGTGALCVVCFLIGAKVGQTTSKGEDIKLPKLNPMEAVRERRDKKEAELEQTRLDVIMKNIESYDGTAGGQRDVPGR